MTLYYDGTLITELGFYSATYTLTYDNFLASVSVQCLIDDVPYENVMDTNLTYGYYPQEGASPATLEIFASSFPELTNPQELVIIVTATKVV